MHVRSLSLSRLSAEPGGKRGKEGETGADRHQDGMRGEREKGSERENQRKRLLIVATATAAAGMEDMDAVRGSRIHAADMCVTRVSESLLALYSSSSSS